MNELEEDLSIGNTVSLHIYDLCQILGQNDSVINDVVDDLSGVWFTGLVVFGWEYVFSDAGVESTKPGETSLGAPHKVEKVGRTEISYPIFLEYLLTVSDSKYRSGSFDLRSRNSTSFCDEILQFICGIGIPKYLFDLPVNLFLPPLSEDFLPRIEKFHLVPAVLNHNNSFLYNCVSRLSHNSRNNSYTTFERRADSPELIELEAQIEALRATRDAQKDRHRKHRSKERDRNEEGKSVEHPKQKKRQSSKHRQERSRKNSDNKSEPEKVVENSNKCDGGCVDQNNRQLESEFNKNCDIPKVAPASALKRHFNKGLIKKRVSFSESAVEVHIVSDLEDDPDDQFVALDSNFRTGSLDQEDPDLPPLEAIPNPRSIFLTDQSYLEDPPSIEEENSDRNNSSQNFDGVRSTRKSPTPPRNPVRSIASSSVRTNTRTRPTMADEASENIVPEDEVEVPKKNQKPKEPPVTFREFNHTGDFEDLVRTIVTMLEPEEQDRLREMEDWIIKNEGTWVLAEGFNSFLGKVLHDKALPTDARVAMLRLLAYGAAQDDIVLIMHMDRKDHVVMNYAQDFDRLPIQEQEALALLFANLFETNSASEWLLYISEWSLGSLDLSNIRVTTKVAVNALLGDTPTLQDYGTAIMHNLGTKEVFDDICTELAMAIMQYWQGKPSEEHVYRTLKAMNKFCQIAHREVPQLIKMIGPEPSKFARMSERVDQLIESINLRLATVLGF